MANRTASRAGQTLSHSHIGDYLRVLYRRRWTAGLALIAVLAYGAFGTLKKTPIYEATTQVLIEKEARRATSLNSVLDQSNSYYDDDFQQTQYRVLQSRSLAWRAVQALGLKPDAVVPVPPPEQGFFGGIKSWAMDLVGAPKAIAPPPADETTTQADLTNGFLGGLTVAPIRLTHLVELRYRSPDPVFAARAANAVAEQYIAHTLNSRESATKETTEYLSTQLEEQRKKVLAAELALQQYQENNDAVGVDDRQNAISQRQSDLNGKLTAARAERIEKEQLFNTLSSMQNDYAALEAFPAVMNSEVVQNQKKQVESLRQEKITLSSRFREGSQQMQDVDRRIVAANDKLHVEIDKVVEAAKNDLRQAQGREASFAQALRQQDAEALQLSKKAVNYSALKDEAVSARRLYDTLLQQASETGVAGEFKGTNIQIVDRAVTPRSPVLPNHSRDLMTSFVLGCLIAVALAFGFEYLDSRIRTPDEIKAHLNVPFLGLVPVLTDKETNGKSALICDAVPPSFAEAIKAVRTAIVFSSADEGARTVVVTSTAPGEGKTLVSTNLAVALAQADQRTLIIDGDMRRPRVHEVFDRLQEPGLSNVLVGTAELHMAVCRTSVQNLFVLSAGHIPPNPAELLGSAKYRDILHDLRHQFDWIIVDAPPVMAVTDAVIAANNATGVVFVIGSEMTSRRHAAFAIEQLTSARAHMIGAVLNRANVQRHGYYYSTYYRKDYTQAYTKS
jgi:capsular exopolysaccharide synthesis family protein